ncbi:MAG: hypothetical protein WCC28_20100 [Mycobacterium sp.]
MMNPTAYTAITSRRVLTNEWLRRIPPIETGPTHAPKAAVEDHSG